MQFKELPSKKYVSLISFTNKIMSAMNYVVKAELPHPVSTWVFRFALCFQSNNFFPHRHQQTNVSSWKTQCNAVNACGNRMCKRTLKRLIAASYLCISICITVFSVVLTLVPAITTTNVITLNVKRTLANLCINRMWQLVFSYFYTSDLTMRFLAGLPGRSIW